MKLLYSTQSVVSIDYNTIPASQQSKFKDFAHEAVGLGDFFQPTSAVFAVIYICKGHQNADNEVSNNMSNSRTCCSKTTCKTPALTVKVFLIIVGKQRIHDQRDPESTK